MTRNDWKQRLKAWDRGEFEFSVPRTDDRESAEQPVVPDHTWAKRDIRAVANWESRVFARVYPLTVLVLGLTIILFLLRSVCALPAFGSDSAPTAVGEPTYRYVNKGLEETGAVNIVAGVIFDYRAFDTLGESHVLFTATVAVFILLIGMEQPRENDASRAILQGDPLLGMTAKVLIPLVMLFGIYVILNGHLGPGGGFSGGAIIGGSLILYSLAFGREKIKRLLPLSRYRRIVLGALSFYSLAKCYLFCCGANGLETVFTAGTPGAIFSAGLILPLNIAVGIVVALTMYGLFSVFTGGDI